MQPPTTSETHEEGASRHGALGHLSRDEELQQTVCQALIEDTELDSSEICVRVAQETVVLSGHVRDAGARTRAVAIATAQRGVAAVRADELCCTDA
jgi:osmotically-inducible protein OsmY